MLIGAATGAAGSAITGGDILQGALMGGIMGAVTGGMGGFAEGSFLTNLGGGSGIMATDIAASTAFGTITQGSALAFAGTSFAGSVAVGSAANAMTPEYAIAADYDPIVFNTIENKVTGSGGTQAAASLSSAIKRVKRKSTTPKGAPKAAKQDVSHVNTSNFSDIGLQIA